VEPPKGAILHEFVSYSIGEKRLVTALMHPSKGTLPS